MVKSKDSSSKECAGALELTSASIFREQDRVFRRTAADRAWDNAARALDPNDPCSNLHMLSGLTTLTAKLPRATTFPAG